MKERTNMSVTQAMEEYQVILEEEVMILHTLTGAVQRQGKIDAATFVQTTIFVFGRTLRFV